MIRRIVFLLALMLLPSAAMAQQHEHHGKHEAAAKAEHMNFARELLAKKTELSLTAEQVGKLEALAVKMEAMHKEMAAKASHDEKLEAKVHDELEAIFTEQQLAKVHPLMKAHMEACKEKCKVRHEAGKHKH